MATVLDSIVITLGFDNSQLGKGAKQSQQDLNNLKQGAQKTGDTLKEIGKQGADAFAAFRREALGALSLFTGGKSLVGFTKDMTDANVALGNLSRQLDIAPQKLTQLHYAMKATGGNPGDIDTMFSGLQARLIDPKESTDAINIANGLGLTLTGKAGHIRGDLIEQLAHNARFQSMPRAAQDDIIRRLNGTDGITNLVTSNRFDPIMKKFENKGPTPEQFAQAQQLLEDWTQLQAETTQIMRKAFSDVEPTIHNFMQALITLEKAHPDAIAHGFEALAIGLTSVEIALKALSAFLTARRFLSALKTIAEVAGSTTARGASSSLKTITTGLRGSITAASLGEAAAGILVAAGIGEAVKYDVETTGHSPWDPYAGLYSSQNNDTAKERERRPVQQEKGHSNTASYNERGIRNNNPGNLNFVGQRGAHLEAPGGRFAAFDTPEAGVAALRTQLSLYNLRDHLDTVDAIFNKYAPKKDHNKTPDYIRTVAQMMGVGTQQHLGKLTPQLLASMMHAIINVENAHHDPYGKMVDRIAGLTDAVPTTSASTTHHHTTTTHAPNVTIHVHGGKDSSKHIADTVSTKLTNTLASHSYSRVM